MRRQAKVDRNHPQIVRELRKLGYSVQSLATIGEGCPDLLVGAGGKCFVFEVKDGLLPPSGRRLTSDEKTWHENWCGQVHVIHSTEEALKVIELRAELQGK